MTDPENEAPEPGGVFRPYDLSGLNDLVGGDGFVDLIATYGPDRTPEPAVVNFNDLLRLLNPKWTALVAPADFERVDSAVTNSPELSDKVTVHTSTAVDPGIMYMFDNRLLDRDDYLFTQHREPADEPWMWIDPLDPPPPRHPATPE